MEFAVLGAGSWGIALSNLLVRNGLSVQLWHYNKKTLDSLTINPSLHFDNTSNFSLSSGVNIVYDKKQAFDSKYILCTIPSKYIINHLSDCDIKDSILINCSKGFCHKNNGLISNVLVELFDISINNICILSGPNHAEEVDKGYATASVIASTNLELATKLQKLISNEYFRLYTSNDINGVQVGGCVKNIVAIAAGICVGLGMGDNTISALVSRSMEEIKRLGDYFDSDRSTFNGLSGLGDLMATSFSKHSRNRQLGIKVALGENLTEIINSGFYAEGVVALKIVQSIAKDQNIDMPICMQMYEILYNSQSPQDGINKLMNRSLTHE